MTQTTHITTSGGLISTAFIENIRQARTNQRGTQLDTFGLPWREAPPTPTALEQAVAETWEALLERWDAIATELPRMDISQVRDRWVLPLLRALDFQPIYQRSDIVLDDSEALRFNISHFGWESKKDERGTMNDEQTQPSSFIIHHCPPPPVHIISPGAGLDARPAGATNSRSAKGKSPHDMVQLFLNVSREHRWGVVTNGLSLRLLRDYHHTYTKGYVEFDLESIFETRNFADFRALYRLTQASRFMGEAVEPADDGATDPADRWDSVPLEMFYRDSQAAGIQVGADLQKQVREAIETLGNGFLASSFQLAAGNRKWAVGSSENDPNSPLPTPHSLLQALQQDPALCQQFYAELLHIVYRVLFLLYAEQRGMVPGSGASLETLYRQSYSLTALRSKAESDPASPEAYDLWEGLKVTFKMFRQGAPDLGVYRYNGMLFAEDQTPILEGSWEWGMGNRAKDPTPPTPLRCRNYELLRAIRALTLIEREGVLQRISYADLNVEEIGGIYESLLDFAPRVTTNAETVEGRDLPANSFFLDPRGTARKTTGSYYTHPSLVNALIESALIPVLEQRVEAAINRPLAGEAAPVSYEALVEEQRRDAEAAILSLKVCDPAMGSGHFLIAANNALALRLAQIRSGDDYPAERELRRARRDVLAHCIYGVDLNPMAVELCKVALWINAAVDDAPLSFLDHHLKCGNSLIGATPELLENGIPDDAFQPVTGDDPKIAAAVRKRNKKEREGQLSLWRVTVLESETDLQQWRDLNELAENQPHLAERRYAAYQADPAYRRQKLVADLWTAAFFWPLTSGGSGLGIGDSGKGRGSGLGISDSGKETNPEPLTTNPDFVPTEELFRQAQADPALVPGRIKAQAAQLAEHHNFFHWHQEFPDVFGEKGEGGFDVVLGNPPWERLQFEEQTFFENRNPEISAESSQAKRREMIKQLANSDPLLYADWADEHRKVDAEAQFLRNCKRFPLAAVDKFNLYAVFSELVPELYSKNGRGGIIVKAGFITDKLCSDLFAHTLKSRRLASAFEFENKQKLFPSVHPQERYALITFGRGVKEAVFSFDNLNMDQANQTKHHIQMSYEDIVLLSPNTKNCPKFPNVREFMITKKSYLNAHPLTQHEPLINDWQVSIDRYINVSDFSDEIEFAFDMVGEIPTAFNVRHRVVPLYEGKLFHQFDHRYATYDYSGDDAQTLEISDKSSDVIPAFLRFLPTTTALRRNPRLENVSGLLALRDITNRTNERGVIAAIIPVNITDYTVRIVRTDSSEPIKTLLLLSVFNTFVFDYLARQRIGGTHLSNYILEQCPLLPPDRYTPDLLAYIVPRVLELTYTAWDLRAFADDVWAEANDERGMMNDEEKSNGERGMMNDEGKSNDERGTRNDEREKDSSFIAHHSSLQDAILQQWEANRDATNGGHEGAIPPAWAEANDERGTMNDESVHHSSFITHRSRFPHPPFKWDEDRRAQLRADLDGLYGHLYGLTREELAYILDTFPIVRRKDEARSGEYRTKRLVLEAYDQLQGVRIGTSEPQTP